MIKNNNKQKSFRFALISSGLFLLLFIIGLVSYISQKGNIAGWSNYDDALNTAKKEQKPIIVNVYSRFNQLSKNINQQIFANEKIKSFFQNNFVLAGINAANKNEKKMLDSKFNVNSLPAYLFLNPDGKEMFRFVGNEAMNIINNFSSEERQKNLIEDLQFFISWNSFDESKKIIKRDTTKFLLVTVIIEPENARKMFYLFDGDGTRKFIGDRFIPVFLNAANSDSEEMIDEINKTFIKDNYPDNDDKESMKLSVNDIVKDFILILDSDLNYITHFNPQTNLYDDEAMKNKLELIIEKNSKGN